MGKITNVEIGQSLPKERWQEAARNLTDLGKVLARNLLARNLLAQNRDGRGKEDADDLMADISLAALALNYVAEFATDKCRFIAVPGGQEK